VSDRLAEWAHHPELVAFYTTHRHRPEDLYPSERRFVPWLAGRSDSLVDVGCAAGGFMAIWRHWSPRLRYTGVDASPELVEVARKLHPGAGFIAGDCVEGLPLPDAAGDAVQALGWLHWEERYPEALAELWRLTGRFLFFDVRLHAGDGDLHAEQRLELTGEWDGHTTVPYLVAGWPRFAELLLALRPASILGTGYSGSPSATVVGLQEDVCFATFVLERGEVPAAGPAVCTDLPLEWPTHMRDAIDLRPAEELAERVPE
jgi:SAM-dependent methyltransferase